MRWAPLTNKKASLAFTLQKCFKPPGARSRAGSYVLSGTYEINC